MVTGRVMREGIKTFMVGKEFEKLYAKMQPDTVPYLQAETSTSEVMGYIRFQYVLFWQSGISVCCENFSEKQG